MQAEELLRAGKLEETLQALQDQVRAKPADASLRVFLFQLLSVMGRWDRAMTQLNVAAEMDAANLLMAQVCRAALNCEAFRAQVFAGQRTPLVFGEPQEWVSLLFQANSLLAKEEYAAARDLRDQAFDAAPATPGTIDGKPFEWIADSDPRFGPMLEAVLNGKYYWVPFANIKKIELEEPVDLRDMVWTPANFTWANGGEMIGLIPSRYPGSELSEDEAVCLARKTEWVERESDWYLGRGQRMLATDEDEHPLLETRQVIIGSADVDQSSEENGDG